MENKSFFITAIVVIAVVSILTSMVGVMLFRPVLMGPGADSGAVGTAQEGEVEILGGVPDSSDVIILDTDVGTSEGFTIDDEILFSISDTGQYNHTDTDRDGINPDYHPDPFVIRNIGNVDAQVELKQYSDDTDETGSLFDYHPNGYGGADGSRLKYWLHAFDSDGEDMYAGDWKGKLDECGEGGCFTASSCTETMPDPENTDCLVPLSTDILDTGEVIITNLNWGDSTQGNDYQDEAIMHILVYADDGETGGDKYTWIEVTGSAA